MLEKIQIKNFKSHSETTIKLKNLTLLVGTNSSGKSSVIQSLLLIIQNISNIHTSPLNGHLVSIGSFSEARNFIKNAKDFEIGVSRGTEGVKIRFTSADDKQENSRIEFLKNSKSLMDFMNYSNKHIHYLSADRIGGQDLYSKNFDRYDEYGLNGEYSIDYLQHHKGDILEDSLVKATISQTLSSQVDYWMEYIFGQRLATTPIIGSDKVRVEYVLKNSRSVRPKNTGSGLSYTNSIIIICLSSKKGDIIIIENPEIHLHPKAQSNLTEFLILIANSGRQLIIESHSDHIFNGVRVNLNNKKILKKNLAIHFFTLNTDTYLTNHCQVDISPRGRINNNEIDLFDQFSKDMKSLIGF